MTDGPFASFDKLSEPLTKLVDVISSGLGTLYEPIGIVRKAKAEAKASLIRARSAGQVVSIEQRVAARLEHREAMRQENLERVAAVAASELPTQVSTDKVDLDWTTQFIDHAQDINDEQMQTLWGRILAGEVTKPGSYSKRTLSFLRTMEKWEAEAFTRFCSAAIKPENGWRFVIHNDAYDDLLRSKFLKMDVEAHFVAIGLLLPNDAVLIPSDCNGRYIEYFGVKYRGFGPPKPAATRGLGSLEIGPSLRNFSLIGQQLAEIAGALPVEGYVERLSDTLSSEYKIRFDRIAS